MAEEAESSSETKRSSGPVILGAPLGLLWSLSLSWWVDEIPIRQMDGLPVSLVWPSGCTAAARLIFQLDDRNDFGNGCGCSHSFF